MNEVDVLGMALQIMQMAANVRAAMVAGVGDWDESDWINAAVAALGATCVAICICRMGKLTRAHKWWPRASYAMLMTGGFCLAFAPWLFPGRVRLGALIFVSAVIGHLLVLGHEWLRVRPPKTMETAPAPLEGESL